MPESEAVMRATRTTWPPEFMGDEPFDVSLGIQPGVIETDDVEQPGFGIGLYWNNPNNKRRPYLLISVWRWRVCIGWLAG